MIRGLLSSSSDMFFRELDGIFVRLETLKTIPINCLFPKGTQTLAPTLGVGISGGIL